MQKAHALRDRLARLTRSRFVRNVATVATGAAAAQAIKLAFSPLLTRLYGPEALGLQGIFFSVTGALAPFAALSYPVAIILPERERDAVALVRLSILVGLCTSSLLFLVLLLAGDTALGWLNATALSSLVYLVPMMTFFGVTSRVVAQWLARHQAYRIGASFGAVTSLLTSTTKAALGFTYPSALALIATNIAGAVVDALLTTWGWLKLSKREDAPQEGPGGHSTLREVAADYREFPLIRAPQNLINGFSQHLPILLLGGYFGAAAAGQYSIALTVLAVPARFIGNAIIPVFYPRVTEAVRRGEDAQKLIIKATLGMAASGALPFLAVALGGAPLFAFVFGRDWQASGHYAQWLSPWLFLQYINKPSVAAISALRREKGLLVYEVFSTLLKVASLWIGFVLFEDDVAAIALFSISGSATYLWLIVWVIRVSGRG